MGLNFDLKNLLSLRVELTRGIRVDNHLTLIATAASAVIRYRHKSATELSSDENRDHVLACLRIWRRNRIYDEPVVPTTGRCWRWLIRYCEDKRFWRVEGTARLINGNNRTACIGVVCRTRGHW